jgi:hypothetical protein
MTMASYCPVECSLNKLIYLKEVQAGHEMLTEPWFHFMKVIDE